MIMVKTKREKAIWITGVIDGLFAYAPNPENEYNQYIRETCYKLLTELSQDEPTTPIELPEEVEDWKDHWQT